MWLGDPFCLQDYIPKGLQIKKYATILLGKPPWIPIIRISAPLCDVPLKVLYDRAPLSCDGQVLFPGPPGVKHSGHPGYSLFCQSSIGSTYQAFAQACPSFLLISAHLSGLSFGTTTCKVPSTSFPAGWTVSLSNVLASIVIIVSGVPFILFLGL